MDSKRVLLPFGAFAIASLAGCAGARFDAAAQLPPPLIASAPSELVVLPGTEIYAAPSFSAGLYFTDGWWWRPWNGRWYRSRYYGGDWNLVSGTPHFYRSVPHDWRDQYYRRKWRGDPWRYDFISREEAITQWDRWKRAGHWRRRTEERDGWSGQDRGSADRWEGPHNDDREHRGDRAGTQGDRRGTDTRAID